MYPAGENRNDILILKVSLANCRHALNRFRKRWEKHRFSDMLLLIKGQIMIALFTQVASLKSIVLLI